MAKVISVDFRIVGPAQPTWLEVVALLKGSFTEHLNRNPGYKYTITLEAKRDLSTSKTV
jgi:hypothetical protein